MLQTVAPVWRRTYEALNSRLRTFAGGRFARFCHPTFIAFLLTERCNARCLHCDIWKNQGREASPGLDEWKKVLRDLRSWLGPVGLVFTGGEVLLYPHALELVQYAISLGFRLETLSNGYCDQAKMERLALADPWRITISLDGIGAAHSKIRGRDDFFERAVQSVDTLLRIRGERNLGFRIRLKTVIMEHNLDDLAEIARFATRDGMDVFYQPVEQNYNTPNDPLWFRSSGNWPRDPGKAVRRVRELAVLRRAGLHIGNTDAQWEAMVRYFQDPAGLGAVTRAHLADAPKVRCAALTMLQFQANGDVTVCANRPPIGNIRVSPVRQLWGERSRVWQAGCCFAGEAAAGAAEAGGGSL
ncbi:MAG: radical SAM protein [Acidobacteriia bacterium]|nr:radical SAM protein [Terriglobia bacterium]